MSAHLISSTPKKSTSKTICSTGSPVCVERENQQISPSLNLLISASCISQVRVLISFNLVFILVFGIRLVKFNDKDFRG